MRGMTLGVAAALSLALPADASAYGYNTCLGEKVKWDSNAQTVGASKVSFPAGYWRNGLQDGVNAINMNPSKFRYSLNTDGGGVGIENDHNEAWGDSGSVLNGAPAIAYAVMTCYWFFGDHVHMSELDVLFDYSDPWQWTADRAKTSLYEYTGSLWPVQTAASHEFGHGLMLLHVNYEYNVMGTDTRHMHANGPDARAYMGEDAADGVTFLYGARTPAWQDVAVAHWKYSGAFGEYSDHTHTVMRNSSNGALPTFTVNGEPGYRVSPGQLVQVEFTYENMGKDKQFDIPTGYFISTNDVISTYDRRIGSTTFTLGRGDVYTTSVMLRIPRDLPSNTNYWLGVILDERNGIAEVVESNNATYIPIRVQ